MTKSYRQGGFIVGFVLLCVQAAWAQQPNFDGAWLEDGLACTDIFVSNGKTISFKRPTNVFVAAFIFRGRQLSTPLATCRIGRIDTKVDRQVLNLNCTTAVATESTRAILALTSDGGLQRYNVIDGGASAKYQRCVPSAPKTP